MTDYETVQTWLRANISMAKKARGLTDKQMAERIGINVVNVTKARMGTHKLGVRRIVDFANCLGVTPAQLLTEPANLEAAMAIDHRSRPRKKLVKMWNRKKTVTQMAGLG